MPSAAEYWVGPTIGEGAFGHVVYAIHKATERKVAIKVMEVPTTTTSHHAREEHRRIPKNSCRSVSISKNLLFDFNPLD